MCAGVCTSTGVIHDFAGFGVTRGNMAFGNPTKYLPLRPEAASALLHTEGGLAHGWDRALDYSTAVFMQRSYGFCTDNCHAYVEHFLEAIRFAGRPSWAPIMLVRFCRLSGAPWMPLLPALCLHCCWYCLPRSTDPCTPTRSVPLRSVHPLAFSGNSTVRSTSGIRQRTPRM